MHARRQQSENPAVGQERAVKATAPHPGGPLGPDAVLALQRMLGNAAVSRLIDEAQNAHGPGTPVQRSLVPEVLRSAGAPLPERVRTDMEARLGADFSDVRLHTGTAARRSAAEIGARAYTSGNHVVIGEGGSDRHTLAHELTHVVQQRQGQVAGTDNGNGLSVSDPADRFERAAEANARRALAGPGGIQHASRETRPGVEQAPPTVQTMLAVQRPARKARTGRSRDQELRLLDHEGQELYAGNDERISAYVQQLANDGRPDIFRLLLHRLRTKNKGALADRLEGEWEREFTRNAGSHAPVPRRMHFVWLGKKPKDGVIENLRTWEQNAAESQGSASGQWTLTLWTDSAGRKWGRELEKTFGEHLKIRYDADRIVKNTAGKDNFKRYKKAKETGAYNVASDILRYSVLKQHGGVYLDVDIAPGGVRLSDAPDTRMHPEEIPVFAPLLRDKKSVNDALGRDRDTEITEDDIHEAARRRYAGDVPEGHTLNNNLIVSRPDSEFMQYLLDRMPDQFARLSERYTRKAIENDLKGQAPDVSGPNFIVEAMKLFTRQHHGIATERFLNTENVALKADDHQHLYDTEARDFWMNVRWVTEESENQLDSEPARRNGLLTMLRELGNRLGRLGNRLRNR
jgi:hypothetical protein